MIDPDKPDTYLNQWVGFCPGGKQDGHWGRVIKTMGKLLEIKCSHQTCQAQGNNYDPYGLGWWGPTCPTTHLRDVLSVIVLSQSVREKETT